MTHRRGTSRGTSSMRLDRDTIGRRRRARVNPPWTSGAREPVDREEKCPVSSCPRPARLPSREANGSFQPGRWLKKCGPNRGIFSPSPNPGSAPVTPARPRVIAPSLRVESRSSTSTGRGSAWFDPSAGGRAHGSLDSVSGREKPGSLTHTREEVCVGILLIVDGGPGARVRWRVSVNSGARSGAV